MRVVALISGGKDSCFNMMHCVKNGHDIVALAHLKPEEKDELDSYMFQTVGHNLIELYAEALGLPLFQRTITGSSVCTDSIYVENNKDEVEDLYKILNTVKQSVDFDAVSSGAILSNYQRVRVENVCSRIGVQSLAYLWQRKQEELLGEMIEADLDAILIKVASLGLKPHVHLGKSLKELAPFLKEMNNKFELNVCGEGGEYETITLDCPLFIKKIVIDEKEIVIHSDDAFAQVGYLSLKKMHLEEKGICSSTTLCQRLSNCIIQIPKLIKIDMNESFPKNTCTNCPHKIGVSEKPMTTPLQNNFKISPQRVVSRNMITWVTEIISLNRDGMSIEECTVETLTHLKELLQNNNCDMKDISIVNVFCSSMKNFAKINSGYKNFFTSNPPARVCVEIPLPSNMIFKMDVCINQTASRNALHVQSLSYWAPANIGPYSQAVSVGSQAYFSGSIGMDPASLNVVKHGIEVEAPLSLTHVNEVSNVFVPQRKINEDFGLVICYIVDQSRIDDVKQFFKCQELFDSSRYLLSIVVVPTLPKNAAIEWNITSKWNEEPFNEPSLQLHGDDFFTYNTNYFKTMICLSNNQNDEHLSNVFSDLFRQYASIFRKTEFMRIYYKDSHISDTENLKCVFCSSLKSVVELLPALSFIPVLGLENNASITVVGITRD